MTRDSQENGEMETTVLSTHNHDENKNSSAFDIESSKAMHCGIGSYRPKFLNRFENVGSFTVIYSFSGLITSTLIVYLGSQITSLERQFGLSSSQSGFLMSSNEIGYLLVIIGFGHVASKVNIPRVMALTNMVFGFAALFCILPHFISQDKFTIDEVANDREQNVTLVSSEANSKIKLCVVNSSESGNGCEKKTAFGTQNEYMNVAIALLSIGMMIQGICKAPRQPLVTMYVDDNCEKTKTGFYMGIITGIGIFGPALGFAVGGVFSKMYLTLQDTLTTPRDPRWIGAWWLGYLLFGILSFITTVPLFLFPKRLKRRKKIVEWKDDANHGFCQSFSEGMKAFLKAAFTVLRNPVCLLLIIGKCATFLHISGQIAFSSKYIETQFFVPAWTANIINGMVHAFSTAFGALVGGYLLKKLRLSPVVGLKWALVFSVISLVLIVPGFKLGCPNPTIYKPTPHLESVVSEGFHPGRLDKTVYQPDGFTNFTLVERAANNSSQCYTDCRCDDEEVFSTCGSDGRTYFSPCFAGCTGLENNTYLNCSCIPDGRAKPGYCETDCNTFIPFIVLFVLSSVAQGLTVMPLFIAFLRSVPDKHKALALGIGAFLHSLAGWTPGPILFGAVIDTACLLWGSSCFKKGACKMYDIEDFRFKIHILISLFKLLQIVCHLAALLAASKLRTYTSTEDETEENCKNRKEKEILLDETKTL